jgi:FtsH-binding integral membrane protein
VAGYIAPMLAVTGVSFGNEWINTGSFDWKILLEGAVATSILALFAQIPDMEPAATAIGWLAFTGLLLSNPSGANSPVQNLLKITGKG